LSGWRFFKPKVERTTFELVEFSGIIVSHQAFVAELSVYNFQPSQSGITLAVIKSETAEFNKSIDFVVVN
jgi:hypothetical protein